MNTSVVLLAFPPARLFCVTYPLGVAYMASSLKQKRYFVTILDHAKDFCSLDKSIEEIVSLKPDFVGITIYSFNYSAAKKIISGIKKISPKTKILIGGPHVSALPKFSLEDTRADFAVIGEAENVMVEIISRVVAGNNSFDDIRGLVFWRDRTTVLNPGCNLITDLDNLSFPAWECLSPVKYNDTGSQVFCKNIPIAAVITSRGCPYSCAFCGSHLIHGRELRKRSFRNVVDEIQFLVKKYGVREINFYDDAFSEDQEHAVNICEEILKRNLDISWKATVGLRLDTLNDELLSVFRASGCYVLCFGIESFSDDILCRVKKPINKPEIIEKIQMIKRYKIDAFGYFILGLPGETEESAKETIRFARSSPLDYITVAHAVPLPGTAVFKKKYKESDLYAIDWDRFYLYTNQPFGLSSVTNNKLKKLFLLAYISFYFKFCRLKKIAYDSFQYKHPNALKIIKFIWFIFRNLF